MSVAVSELCIFVQHRKEKQLNFSNTFDYYLTEQDCSNSNPADLYESHINQDTNYPD
jgi:hypothetical protein